MSESTPNEASAAEITTSPATPVAASKLATEADTEPGTASKIPKGPSRSSIPTPAASATGIPVKQRPPSNFGSTNSISKIGRPCCTHTTPKSGPPPRDTNSMSRESDDNLSSINSAYTDHNSAVLTANTEQFIIGQRVWVGGLRSGQIAYIGETHFAPGDWAGIVLDEPNGKNDGCVSGKRYFQCEPKRGIFSRLTRLTTYPLSGAITPTSPLAKNSPERSRTVSPTASVRSSMLRSPGIGKNGLTVGDRVIVSSGFGSRPGILRYLGETQFAPGNWCGVELDEGSGKNDGAVDGIRYFECKPKFGVFVPIAKVSLSPSTKKTRLSRTGSRESLTSIGTMNSIATTNTSRMRMNAQRKSSTPLRPIVTTPKNQFSMQDLLREKQHHVEQLMVERDLDREDAQNQALQLQKKINELKARVLQLESQLGDERKKSEELQFSIDEAQFCGDEMSAQSQVYKEKINDLEKTITQLVSATPSLQSVPPVEDNGALTAAQSQITQLQDKLGEQEKLSEARLAESLEEEKRLRENIVYLQSQNATLQTELVGKDESLEKFSLSQCGIENLRRELALLKEDNEKQTQQAKTDFELQLAAKEEQLQLINSELQQLKSSSDTLESERANVTDECEILQTEIRMRDEQIKELSQQLDELTTQLNVQKADSSALDEMLKAQQSSNVTSKSQLEQLQKEHSDLQAAHESSLQAKSLLEQQLNALQQTSQEQLLASGDHQAHLKLQQAECVQLKLQKEALEELMVTLRKELDLLQQTQQAQLEDSKTEINEREALLKAEREQLQQVQQQLAESLKAKAELEAQQVELKQAAEQLRLQQAEQLTKEQAKSAEFEAALKAAQLQQEQLQQQANVSGQEGAQQLAKLQAEFNELQAQAKQTASALEASHKELSEAKQQTQTMQETLQQRAAQLEAAKQQQLELETQLKASAEQRAQNELQLGDVQRQHEALQHKCETLQQHEETLQAELVATRGSLEQQQEKLQQELSSVRGEHSELSDKLAQLTQQLSGAQKELSTQQDASSAARLQLERELQETRQQLQASQAHMSEAQLSETAQREQLVAEAQQREAKLQQQLEQLQLDQQQQSSGNELAVKELQERLEITNTELQHKEQLAREDAQKIADLKTLVEAIQVANANISATNAELSTVLEVLQAEKSETAHIFELFEMEADMNAERLIEKLQGMKQELQQTHSALELQQSSNQQLQAQLQQSQHTEQTLQGTAVEAAEQLRQLQQANGELQEAVQQAQAKLSEVQQELQLQQSQLTAQQSGSSALQQQLQQLQQSEQQLKDSKTQLEQQLLQLQAEHVLLQQSAKQQLEKDNEFDARLTEYQKVIDEMDEASSAKSAQLLQLQARIVELELAVHQAKQSEQMVQMECQQLTHQLQALELEEAREIMALRANGSSPSKPQTQEQLDTETSLAKINFLNSIIADMQQKNDALKAKVQTLETLPMDFTKPQAFDLLSKRKPAPRLFCDICDEFDKHETEDCPLQASEDRDYSPPPPAEANNNEKKERKLPAPRKYCDSCEVFGHDTSECADDETY
ncbi:hypothetical protein KR093_000032 [Drosophila rubida]|uniref:CAP-Gly domain-containing protein n=1 Tax=Drosophila rubida TaxID=30044 RepID=A0AAD4K2Z7_9MUSC|nr:hypothetical protein KR093_000032 [Drosophila rubida]